MKYTCGIISINVSSNQTVYEVRKNSTLLDRVIVYGENMGEVAEKCRNKALAGGYGTQYFKQMLVCTEIASMSARAVKHMLNGNEENATTLFGWVKETILNSGMDKDALFRMASCFASQYGVRVSFLFGKPMISMY